MLVVAGSLVGLLIGFATYKDLSRLYAASMPVVWRFERSSLGESPAKIWFSNKLYFLIFIFVEYCE